MTIAKTVRKWGTYAAFSLVGLVLGSGFAIHHLLVSAKVPLSKLETLRRQTQMVVLKNFTAENAHL